MKLANSVAKTTAVRSTDPTLRAAISLGLIFASIKLLLHIVMNMWQTHIGYGYFRDEFYYLICGRHLAWGYVDHGPIVALQARFAETVFGHSLAGIRMLSGVAGAIRVFLTGLLVWSLGGRRPAQALSMLGILLAPQLLALDSYLCMNSCESVFWMSCLLAIIQIVKGSNEKKFWVVFGISAGLGLLNKPSMTFFLVALLFALLLTRQRRILFSRWCVVAIALLILIAAPNLLWQVTHHWPTLEFLHNGQVENKNIRLGAVAFITRQIQNLEPLTIFLWVPGLIWLLRRNAWRWLGNTYILFLTFMMLLHAKDYYVAPIYPILFAAGGIAWEQRFATRRLVAQNFTLAFPIYESLLFVVGLTAIPMAIPVMTPATWLAYTKATHLYSTDGNTENTSSGILPQFYADRFGWQEEVDEVTRIYRSLSPEDQANVGILCSNYGEASAINFLGHGLPFAISGHNNYWLWGPGAATGKILIVINGASPEEMRKYYDSVEIAGHMGSPFSMPYERRNIYLARGRRKNLNLDWENLKHYI